MRVFACFCFLTTPHHSSTNWLTGKLSSMLERILYPIRALYCFVTYIPFSDPLGHAFPPMTKPHQIEIFFFFFFCFLSYFLFFPIFICLYIFFFLHFSPSVKWPCSSFAFPLFLFRVNGFSLGSGISTNLFLPSFSLFCVFFFFFAGVPPLLLILFFFFFLFFLVFSQKDLAAAKHKNSDIAS